MGEVFTKNTKNKEDAILGEGNNGIWKNGMCVTTALTNDSGNTDFLIDRFSMDDVDDGTLISGMGFTISF